MPKPKSTTIKEIIDAKKREIEGPDIEEILESEKWKIKSRNLQTKYNKVLRELKRKDSLIETMSEIQGRQRVSTSIKPHKTRAHRGEGVAIQVVTDVHIGKLIDPDTVNQMSAYNPEIAERRFRNLFKNSLRWINHARKITKINTLVIVFLGDIINNYLHDDDRESNPLCPAEEVILATDISCDGLDFLQKNGDFRTIDVICKLGNHGRTSNKPRNETAWKNNLEWLLYHDIARHYRKNSKVNFLIEKGALTYKEIYGKNFRLFHGSEISYRGGITGMQAPAGRKLADWDRSSLAVWDETRPAAWNIFGHLHSHEEHGRFLYTACGSLVGWSAYALRGGFVWSRPNNPLIIVSPKYGIIETRKIFVD